MNQREYSDYIIPLIIKQFPQFKDCCIERLNDIVDIEFKSKKGKLTLWLTTQDKEVTIGFTGETQLNDWHTHMGMYGANTPDEEIQVAVEFIESIINDKEKIVHSTIVGYTLTEDIGDIKEYQQEGEIIESFYWSNL